MARKKATASSIPNAGSPNANDPLVIPSQPDNTSSSPMSRAPLPPVKINPYSLTELKNTCDDALKKFLSQPDLFTQQHTHTDIRLGLGYSSTLIAAGTALYGWKTEFEKSKPIVTVGVALYFLLTFLQTVYVFFIEKNTVFVGKRKIFAGRIETERLTVYSKTIPSSPTSPPLYSVEVSYLHSANGGKALLKRGRETAQKGYNAFFDSEGNMATDVFEKWAEGLVAKATAS